MTKGLTLAQVGQFTNCLIEARNQLKHKSEIIQRKFTITKALLKINKLELEQKRLEEDTFVYNWLQQQLKLSPAYKKAEEWETKINLELMACQFCLVYLH